MYKNVELSIVSNKNISSSEDNNWAFRKLIIGPSGSSFTSFNQHFTSFNK